MRCWCFLFSILIAGCTLTGDDALEAQLRAQEDRIRVLETQLSETEHTARVAQKEASTLRAQLREPDAAPRREQLAVGLAVEELEIHNMLTGFSENGELHAVIRPVDADGDLIKLPGKIEVRLVNLAAPNGSQQLGKWEFSDTESRALWSSAAIGAGYVVDLPAGTIPADAELMLHARFAPSDGRQFDASHSLRVSEVTQASFEEDVNSTSQ